MLTVIESFKEWAVELMSYAYEARSQGNEYGYAYQWDQIFKGLNDLADDYNLSDDKIDSIEQWLKSQE